MVEYLRCMLHMYHAQPREESDISLNDARKRNHVRGITSTQIPMRFKYWNW
jgi:hypothetical protein